MKKARPVLVNFKIVDDCGYFHLVGDVYNNSRFAQGERIRTSALEYIDFKKWRAKTKNTVYDLR